MSRPEPNWVSRAPENLYRVLTAKEAEREFGLHHEQIYAAVARDEVHAVAMPPRDDRAKRGQTRYPEWELSKLAERLGLTAPRILELPREETNSKLSYFHQRAA